MNSARAPLEKLLGELAGPGASRDDILDLFLQYIDELGMQPYQAQEEAFLELFSGKHVILNTPTGSGKSLVALALHFLAMAENKVSFYAAPTKALVNEKFFALCDAFGARNVGLLTGDASINSRAGLICCTMEILSNMALRSDDLAADCAVLDEFHYYGDEQRGIAWQIPLITLSQTQFLLMSATLGDTSEIGRRLREFSGREVAVVSNDLRPVPLQFEYRETPVHQTIEDLLQVGEAPIYLVNFTQRDCAEQAQNLTSVNICSREEKKAIAAELAGERFTTPYGKEFLRFVRNGIGVHHAGLLPRYRRVVERLAQAGLVKVISGTDTLGVGVNIPIRTVLLRQLYKYDGHKSALLSARQFHQIAGRAGRKGFDEHGRVVVQAPEWLIENRRIKAKIAANTNLKKKLSLKKPPPRAVAWDRARFEKLLASPPEPLEPRFEVSFGMVLNLLAGEGGTSAGGYRRLLELISRSHASQREKKYQRRRAAIVFRALTGAGILKVEPGAGGATVEIADELQDDFSLNHSLSLYLVETLELLDPDSEVLALDMLSLVEAVIDSPKVILRRQLDKLKGELLARLKAEGVEYQERMEALDKLEHPKPNAEFIYDTFNAFAEQHPWLSGENIRPKSIAREMYEDMSDFNDYVRQYKLERSEGVLLRYLGQAYKTAVQNVPEQQWNDDFIDILAYLYGVVGRTDSSLLDEWELLVAGPAERGRPQAGPGREPPQRVFDRRAFAARARNELHVLLKCLADRDYRSAARAVGLAQEDKLSAAEIEKQMEAYFEEHAAIDTTPRARQARNTILIQESDSCWSARQKIIDPEGDEDWTIYCRIDLDQARDPAEPLIELERIGL